MKIKNRLIVIDSSFSYLAIKTRKLEHSVTCRDLDGFFDHVWSVHPFASLLYNSKEKKNGKARVYPINPRHTFIDGKVGIFSLLNYFPKINFFLSQAAMIVFLYKLIKREKINIIRAADPLYNGIMGFVLSKLTNIPFLIRVGSNHDKIYETTGLHIMPNLFPNRKIEKMVGRFILSKADCVAGANNDNLEFAISNGAILEKTTIFRYGNLIDEVHFIDPRERVIDNVFLKNSGICKNNYMLFVGRLSKVKLPDHPIMVLSELKKNGHDIKLLIAGDGPLMNELRDMSVKLDLKNDVVFCGNCSQDILSSLYSSSAIVLSPHTGRALAEAALAGSKIVAYDIDWQKEIIETNMTGVLVNYLDIMGMVDAVEKILNNKRFGDRIGRFARKKALEMMEPNLLNDHERKTYINMISNFNKEKRL